MKFLLISLLLYQIHPKVIEILKKSWWIYFESEPNSILISYNTLGRSLWYNLEKMCTSIFYV